MNFKYYLIFLFPFFIFSCTSQDDIIQDNEEVIEEVVSCISTNISISEEDNIIFNDPTDPVVWQGYFTEEQVHIYYTIKIGSANETETFNYIFDKKDNCLKLNRAYKFYNGREVDVSAITAMNVSEFYIKDWDRNSLFSGLIVYQDPHDKEIYSKKFWVDDLEKKDNANQTPFLFEDCYANKLPIEIDINNDDIIDFSLGYVTYFDIGNTPKFRTYTLRLIPASNKNKILSPKKNNSPYTVVFEPPFSTENTNHYFGGVKHSLDVFYEFVAPYESYNYFLSNNLTYRSFFENEIPNYFLIRKEIGNEQFYGWIKFELDTANCSVAVVETYLQSEPNVHVQVN